MVQTRSLCEPNTVQLNHQLVNPVQVDMIRALGVIILELMAHCDMILFRAAIVASQLRQNNRNWQRDKEQE
ncbi:hypothetical protein Tco_0168460 [Tanacetum coccineum]